jgi:hypothetical protein
MKEEGGGTREEVRGTRWLCERGRSEERVETEVEQGIREK